MSKNKIKEVLPKIFPKVVHEVVPNPWNSLQSNDQSSPWNDPQSIPWSNLEVFSKVIPKIMKITMLESSPPPCPKVIPELIPEVMEISMLWYDWFDPHHPFQNSKFSPITAL